MILVVVDAALGRLSRYECSAPKSRLTHRYDHLQPVEFPADVVEEMRLNPPAHMAIEPPPQPPLPPAVVMRTAA